MDMLVADIRNLAGGELGTAAVPEALRAQGVAGQGMDTDEYATARTWVQERIRQVFPAAAVVPAVEWEHGNPDDVSRYGGPLILSCLPGDMPDPLVQVWQGQERLVEFIQWRQPYKYNI